MADLWWKNSTELGLKGESLVVQGAETVFTQGSYGSQIYLVEEGAVEVYLDGKLRVLMQPGDFFGEIGALTNLPRSGTAVSLKRTKLLVIEAEQLRVFLSQSEELRENFLRKLSARLFHVRNRRRDNVIHLSLDKCEDFFSSFELVELDDGEIVCDEGYKDQDLYFILWGSLEVCKNGRPLATRGAGEFVGEIACMRNTTRQASVVALEPTALLKCSKPEVEGLIKRHAELGQYLKELAADRLIRIPR